VSNKPVITIRSARDVDVEAMRQKFPDFEIIDRRRNRQWPVDVLLLWLFVAGIWPMADPAHNFDTLAGALDLIVHFGAWLGLMSRWKVERR
jgi:hypothetical protein